MLALIAADNKARKERLTEETEPTRPDLRAAYDAAHPPAHTSEKDMQTPSIENTLLEQGEMIVMPWRTSQKKVQNLKAPIGYLARRGYRVFHRRDGDDVYVWAVKPTRL